MLTNVWTRNPMATRALKGALALALALTLALLVPLLGLPQAVTGPLVNAILLLTVAWVGLPAAILVGMATPLSALLRGVLPLPLAIMIPSIAIGNATLVSVYQALRNRHHGLAIVAAAGCKFGLLYGVVTLLTANPLRIVVGGAPTVLNLPPALVQMMGWPQLATALAGGLIAWSVSAGARWARAHRTR